MSLVAGRGPLSPDPAGRFSAPLPDDLVYVEPHHRRVQAIRDGRLVIEDVAWSYPDPPPESLPIKGFLSFDPTRADVVAEIPL
ncbi:MAG: DUF427 domain-containing protein [Mycobacterium sp.]